MEDEVKVASTGSKSRKTKAKKEEPNTLLRFVEPCRSVSFSKEENRFNFSGGLCVEDYSSCNVKDASKIKSNSKIEFNLFYPSKPNIELVCISESYYEFAGDDFETILRIKRSAITDPIGFSDTFNLSVRVIQP